MIKKLTKAQSKKLLKAVDAAEECIGVLRLLGKKKITDKDKEKFQSCLSKILGVKPKKKK